MDKDSRGGWTSASNAEADSLCPGRHLLQRGLPEEKSADAEFGTALHAALKLGSDEGLSLDQKDLYESCEKIVEKVGEAFFGVAWEMVRAHPIKEERLWSHIDLGGTDRNVNSISHSGQVDRAYIDTDGAKALILEFKSLAGTVAGSPRNQQLRDQAALVYRNFFPPDEADGLCIGTAVIQPLVTHTPEICLYNRADLEQSVNEMHRRVVNSNTPGVPRVAGDAQCKFCKAKKLCPEYGQWASAQLPVPRSLVDLPMSSWNPEQWGLFLNMRLVAEKWLSQGESMAKTLLKANSDAIPGWGLKDGAIRETVNDATALLNRLHDRWGKSHFAPSFGAASWEHTVDLFMKCLSVKKKEFKEVVHQISGLKGQALDKAVDELLAGLVDVKQNQPSIERKDSK